MLVIWNPNAGSVRNAARIKSELTRNRDVELAETNSSDEAIELVCRQIGQGERRIVAAGGDGTVNAVINGMMRESSDAELAVLPLGTANDWCASLGIPDDLWQAKSLIDGWNARPLDIIELESPHVHKYFANIATGGNSQRVTESITPEMKRKWGALCYLRGAIGIVPNLQTYHASISFDDGPAEEFNVWNIIVANGQTSAGRLMVAPKAKLDDGLLDIVIIRDGTVLDLAEMTVQFLTSQSYVASEQVEYRQAKTITLTSEPPLLFSIDGDLVEEQPSRFRVKPKAINVVVGPKFPSAF